MSKLFDLDDVNNKNDFELKVINYIKTNMYDKEKINKFNSTINCTNFLIKQAFDIEMINEKKENKFMMMMSYINETAEENEYLKLRTMLNYVTLINNINTAYLYEFDESLKLSIALNQAKLKKLEEIIKIIGHKYVYENIKNIDLNELKKIIKKLNALDTTLENRYDCIVFSLEKIENLYKAKEKIK